MNHKLTLSFIFLNIIFLQLNCHKGPKDKTDIQKIYKRYHQAIKKEDLDTLKSLITAEQKEKLSGSQADSVIKMINQLLPEKVRIIDTEIAGNSAQLEVSGALEGKTIKGNVQLAREGGRWKIAKENWQVTFDMATPSQESTMSGFRQQFMSDPSKPPKIHEILKGHQAEISCLVFSPDSQFLVSASYGDYSIRTWDLNTGEEISRTNTKNRVRSLKLSSDGGKIFTGDAYHNILLWPLEFGKIGSSRTFITNAGDEIAISPDGKYLAATGYQLPVQVWDLNSRGLLKKLRTTSDQRTLAFSSSGKFLAGGSGKKNIYNLWETPKWKHKSYKITKIGRDSYTTAIDFSPTEELMASGHNDSSIVIYDLKKRKELHNYYVPNASTMDVKFSLDGNILATAHYNGSIYLWESRTAKQITVLKEHKTAVTSLAFSPDGTTLASGGEDRTIILWKSGEPEVPPVADNSSITPRVSVSPTTEPGMTEFAGKKNLLKNPSANQLKKFWKTRGEVSIEDDDRGNPGFSIRYNGQFWQDIAIPEGQGGYALLIAWTSSERINNNGDITGLPYLYGYMLDKKDRNRINAYLQGQKMRHSLLTPNTWALSWGVFELPKHTGAIRIFLQQASGRSAQTGSAARFDDVGIFLFYSREEAEKFAEEFEFEKN